MAICRCPVALPMPLPDTVLAALPPCALKVPTVVSMGLEPLPIAAAARVWYSNNCHGNI